MKMLRQALLNAALTVMSAVRATETTVYVPPHDAWIADGTTIDEAPEHAEPPIDWPRCDVTVEPAALCRVGVIPAHDLI